jgi:hypothetical protein
MTTIKKRVFLTFGNKKLVESPVIWLMANRYPEVVFDIRQASVSNDIGIMAINLEGEIDRVQAALNFLAQQGVTVEPIEKTIVEAGKE